MSIVVQMGSIPSKLKTFVIGGNAAVATESELRAEAVARADTRASSVTGARPPQSSGGANVSRSEIGEAGEGASDGQEISLRDRPLGSEKDLMQQSLSDLSEKKVKIVEGNHLKPIGRSELTDGKIISSSDHKNVPLKRKDSEKDKNSKVFEVDKATGPSVSKVRLNKINADRIKLSSRIRENQKKKAKTSRKKEYSHRRAFSSLTFRSKKKTTKKESTRAFKARKPDSVAPRPAIVGIPVLKSGSVGPDKQTVKYSEFAASSHPKRRKRRYFSSDGLGDGKETAYNHDKSVGYAGKNDDGKRILNIVEKKKSSHCWDDEEKAQTGPKEKTRNERNSAFCIDAIDISDDDSGRADAVLIPVSQTLVNESKNSRNSLENKNTANKVQSSFMLEREFPGQEIRHRNSGDLKGDVTNTQKKRKIGYQHYPAEPNSAKNILFHSNANEETNSTSSRSEEEERKRS